MKDERIRLLNPGPVTLSSRVRRAMLGPDLCHREPDFARLLREIRARLAGVYPEGRDQYEAIVLAGSGTAAVEAMLASLVPHSGKALVVANGVYGERMASMLELQGKPFDCVRSAWTAPLDMAGVHTRLAAGGFSHVVAVHHETTTGRLNDLPALGGLCRALRVRLLLDAVSSFGGEDIDLEGWNVAACAATANKCLHGVPGACFVLAQRQLLSTGSSAARSLYLDLFRNFQEQGKDYPAFTPAVQSLYALREALCELEEEGGWQARRRHYGQLSERLRAGLRELGIGLLLHDAGAYASMLSSFILPPGVSFPELFEHLKRERFVIYPGQQALEKTTFRVAVMGELSLEDINELLSAFAAALGAPPARRAGGR